MKLPILCAVVSLGCTVLAPAALLMAVTDDNHLVSFDSAAPGTTLSSVPVSGLLDPLASLLNITYHVGEGRFYGLDSNANFYSIGLDGAASLLNDTFAPTGYSGGLSYDSFTGDLVFSSITAEHFSLSTAGQATSNPDFVYGVGDPYFGSSPSVFAIALDPIFGEAFMLDNVTGTLARSVDPALSEWFTIGSLGMDVTSFGALVVDEDGNLFASLSEDGLNSALYSIDPSTGAATLVGNFAGGVSGLAIVPEPSTALIGGIGMLFLIRRRRA